ncbi:MAG: hypothetical protein O3B64_01805 [bacterium]|nr:hypothetical protein [bacterium]MDA1024353.1 hypothetical protein [bacterium]
MNNFLLGIESLVKLMRTEVMMLIDSPIFLGLLVGFMIASLVYGFIVTSDRYRHQLCKDPKHSVKK